MLVWVIKAAEGLPIDENQRLARVGMLSEYLTRKGHKVVWWASTYLHGIKKYRYSEQKEFDIEGYGKIILLHSPKAYKKNISLARIRFYERLAREFRRNAEHYEKPDVILCSYPTPQFAREAIKYGRKNKVPVILDVRDSWPDVFTLAFPSKMRWLVKIAILPMTIQAKSLFRKADAITGVVPAALEWGLKKAGRKKGKLDRAIFIGYKPYHWENEDERINAISKWGELGVTEDTWNICFISTMSNATMDIETCISAAERLTKKYPKIHLVLAGDGDGLERYKKAAGGNPNIVFPGFIGSSQIASLMEISKAGLYAMSNRDNNGNGIGNKVVGYMSAGLPIISEAMGISKTYIEKYNMGLIYEEKNVKSCYEVIEKLYLDEQTRQRMGENAYKCFCAEFHADVVNKQFEDMLDEVVKDYREKQKES